MRSRTDEVPASGGWRRRLAAMRLMVRHALGSRRELAGISGWDTVKIWRYATVNVATRHNTSFMDSPRFIAAYDAAMTAARRDHWNAGMHFRLHQALWCADVGLGLGGNFVELGTGRGMTFAAVLTAIDDWDRRETRAFLFDTFESSVIDDETGLQDGALGTSPVYAESAATTRATFARWDRVELVPGLLPASLTTVDVGRVGFLHIDLNTPSAEVESLRALWPRLIPGAPVLLDDYAHVNSEPQYEAMNRLADELGVSILTLATGQGLIITPPR